MADFTSIYPDLHVHGVARFREGKFSATDAKTMKALRASEYVLETDPEADPEPEEDSKPKSSKS